MESSLRLLLVLIATVAIIHLVQAQDQRGFISLDCGLPANEVSPYNETSTGLQFSSDAEFIKSGETGRIQKYMESDYFKPYKTLRYFREGTRNCYNIPVDKGRMYLIRAWFLYGNYDGLDINPKFDLYLGPNLWTTMDMQKPGNNDTREEMLHIPTSDSLQICLVKTGTTTPFISSLELRPMGNKSYITTYGSLKLLRRIYYTKSDAYIRYPGDAYDRIWNPRSRSWLTHISTTKDVSNGGNYNLPEAVRQNAAIPTNVSDPLRITWTSENPNDEYYTYEHNAEIQDLQANETREFIEFWNGNSITDPITPKILEIKTIQSVTPRTCQGGECSLQLTRTERSTLPPLLNAYEIYSVIQFMQPETNEDEVFALKSIQDTYKLSRINWQGDPCVPQHLMWDGLNCSDTIISTSPPRVTSLNLSSIGLTGTIAAAIQNLTQLENLDLSNNKLTGELPEFLGNIKSLLFINLSGNNLNGLIPQTLERRGVLLHGNPRLCHFGSSCSKPRSKKLLVAIVALASVVIVIATLIVFLVLKKKKVSTVQAPLLRQIMSPMVNITRSDSPKPLIELKTKRFTYSEVITMTNNFQRALGKGGFGIVYHGNLNDSEQVAVKVCNESSTQFVKQFKAEVDLLLRVHHTNLVNLVGYCDEGDRLALIYEFVPNGDLKEHMSGKHGRPIINWGMRLRIAVDSALGLEYLHSGCKPSMIHRDVKTANILLGEHFQAKLADFGLSRSSPVAGETHVSASVVAGTPGYLDPEYHDTGRLSEKSDVYSFGIVLLEMITNKPVIDGTRENSNIAQWVRFELNQGEITKIMDPNLCVDYNSPSVWSALALAVSCADPSSTKRPTMSQVVSKLKECIENLRASSELL
ncbi:probable LRR receptor-like serine/threonine-protein kinase At5g59680 [Eutrema salsugineum]|uniref:probable LRR receptor-like serine/threonine-protein kinase At5g59680 n=1 Tax=Eutrema salsugineum TaxID=72664 RepID=UPI000CED26D4|nr:probable LRR receptor-like serine/threonine-protein kinase At5g59680 [Eutrema salsugineum]